MHVLHMLYMLLCMHKGGAGMRGGGCGSSLRHRYSCYRHVDGIHSHMHLLTATDFTWRGSAVLHMLYCTYCCACTIGGRAGGAGAVGRRSDIGR